jgi:pilus assembly protein Flp/PilA
MNLVTRLVREEEGQDLIEYVLLAAGIGVALIPTVPLLATALQTQYGNVTTAVNGIGGGS